MTLEEKIEELAKKGLLGVGLEEETADSYAPWAALLAQFAPGVGAVTAADNTRDAVSRGDYGEAAIEAGLGLLGEVPGIGDAAVAGIKGLRRAPDGLLKANKADEIAIPERPEGLPKFKKDMTPEQVKEYDAWKSEYQKAHYKLQHQKKGEAKNAKKRAETQARKEAEKKARISSGQLLPQDMTPDQLREYNAEMMRRHRAKRSEEKILADRERDRVSAAKRRDAINADPERRAEYLSKKSEQNKIWRANNPEAARQKHLKEYEKDPARAYEKWVRRSHAEKQRTPEWRDQEKINEIYRARSLIQELTGIPHHVDHIIPLRGREVSGLHHQDNLMIVPGAENLSKGRTFTPGTPPPKTGGVRQARRLLKQLEKARKGQ